MCVIHICVQCSEKFSELLVNDVQDSELTVESIVGTALLEIFDTVYVEDVKLFTAHSTTVSMEGDGGVVAMNRWAMGNPMASYKSVGENNNMSVEPGQMSCPGSTLILFSDSRASTTLSPILHLFLPPTGKL